MNIVYTISNYLFVFGLGILVGVIQRPYALEKIFDYCISK